MRDNGMQQVIQNLSTMEKNIVQEIVYGCQAVQAQTITDARSFVPIGVTGALSQSLQPGAITVSDDNVEAVVEANADYASFVEFGTRPHFPPVEALKDWAAKFLGDEALAFLVARAISRRGTIAHPFLGPALVQNLPVFRNAMAAAVKRGIEGSRR